MATIGKIHIGNSTGTANFLKELLNESIAKIIRKIRILIIKLKAEVKLAGINGPKTNCARINIKGPTMRYILELGTKTAKTPKIPKTAPLAPIPGILLLKINPDKTKNTPPRIPESK